MTFRERYEKWKAGELVYSAGKILPEYDGGKDKRPSYYQRAEDLIVKGEGFRSGVYQNKGDVPTAGYGFTAKEDLHKWNEADARKRLREIMMQNEDSIRKSDISDWYFNKATEGQKAAILDMMYQGGAYRLNKMPNFVKAIQSGDMNAAAKEFNFAASQTPNRHKARYNAFMEGVTTPADIVNLKLMLQQTVPTDNIKVQLQIPNVDQVVQPGLEYINRYSGDLVRPSLSQMMLDKNDIWNLLNTPQYIIDMMQFVPQFELNQSLITPHFDDGKDLYVVRKNDNLWNIAKRVYGDPLMYKRIAEDNGIINPNLIQIGLVLNLGNKLKKPEEKTEKTNTKSVENTEKISEKKYGSKIYDSVNGGYEDEYGNPVEMIGYDNDGNMRFRSQNGDIGTSYNASNGAVIYGSRKLQIPQYDFSQQIQIPQFTNEQLREDINNLLSRSQNGQDDKSNSSGFLSGVVNKINRLVQSFGKNYTTAPSFFGLMADVTLPVNSDISGTFRAGQKDGADAFWQILGNGLNRRIHKDDGDVTSGEMKEIRQSKLKKPIKVSDVIDENLTLQEYQSPDTLYWKDMVYGSNDRTKNKIFMSRSKLLTPETIVGSRNRGDYHDIESNDAGITAYDAFMPYENFVNEDEKERRHWSSYSDNIPKGYKKQLQYIGYDKDGHFKIGPFDKFTNGDTMTVVPFWYDVEKVNRDQNGNLSLEMSPDSKYPGRKSPTVVSTDGVYYDDNGNSMVGVRNNNRLVGIATGNKKDNYSTSKIGNVSGGSLIIQCGKETRLITGSSELVMLEIEKMQKNHKGKKVRVYECDNGSYNRALRVKSGNITKIDLEDYERQNVAGGNLMYFK